MQLLNKMQILEKESGIIRNIFNFRADKIPDIPEWITNDEIQFWADNFFYIHYVPKISIDENLILPERYDRPSKYFYKKIKEGKLKKNAKILSGKWILIDGRDKPAKRVPWMNINEARIFEKIGFNLKCHVKKWKKQVHQKEYLLNVLKERGFGSRFCLNIKDINNLKPFVLDFLKINPSKTIRLPFFIEYNYLGNIIYKQWKTTETWEWLEDKLDKKYNLASGSKSISCMAWDPPDFWSTILTFRPVIEL